MNNHQCLTYTQLNFFEKKRKKHSNSGAVLLSLRTYNALISQVALHQFVEAKYRVCLVTARKSENTQTDKAKQKKILTLAKKELGILKAHAVAPLPFP